LGELLLGWRYCRHWGSQSFSGLFQESENISEYRMHFLMGLGSQFLPIAGHTKGFVMSLAGRRRNDYLDRVKRRDRVLRLLLVRVVLPLSLLLCLTAGAIGYYNLASNWESLPVAVRSQ